MNEETRDDIRHIIRRFYDIPYINKRIIRINNELEYITNRLTGLSSPSMSERTGGGRIVEYPDMELMMKEEGMIRERENLQAQILEYEELYESLDPDVKRYIIELYILSNRHGDIAKRYHYTRQALYDKINRNLAKVLLCK